MSGETIMPANPVRIMEYTVKLTRTTVEVAEVTVFIEDVKGAALNIKDLAINKANCLGRWSTPETTVSASETRQESTGEYLPKIQRDWGSDVR